MAPQIMEPNAQLSQFNSQTITWERLEAQRLQRLGLSNKYSRHFNVLRTKSKPKRGPVAGVSQSARFVLSGSPSGVQQAVRDAQGQSPAQTTGSQLSSTANSLAPFTTQGKPTCGFFFSDGTDNRKCKFGIPPSDLVKWRNFSAAN